jgi:CRP/FNR family transcriptional regulator
MDSATVVDLRASRRSCHQCLLRRLCLTAGIGADAIDSLDRVMRRRKPINRNAYVFRAGSALARIYVAREGSFKTVVNSENGEQQIIGFHLPGEIIGLDALGSGIHRCDAIALETACVCEVALDDLHAIAAHVPGLQRQLLRVIGHSMGRDQDHLEMMSRRQAGDRVLLFLQRLAERFAALGGDNGTFHLPMTREDIASYLGLVIETVSRSFTRLQEDGFIAVRGREVRLLARSAVATPPHAARAH